MRVALAVLAGVLLLLPVFVLLSGALHPAVPQESLGGRRISPVLDTESALRLSTYHRTCGPNKPCDPPLGCVWDTRIFKHYCTDSLCTTDAQCPEGQVCQAIATDNDGPLVRFCIARGQREEKERCLALTLDQASACKAGLLCGGHGGWCARPCQKGAAVACDENFFCADTIPEPVCLPTCEASGCPAEQSCIRDEEGASACVRVYGANCQQTPCPDTQVCGVRYNHSRPGYVWMECVERCGEGSPPCAAGRICDGGECRTACSPELPHVCGEGYHCAQLASEGPYTCEPNF